jgi:tetratricopeptide (TPR) repeat protein
VTKTDDPITKMNIKCYQGKFDEALKIADDEYMRFKANTSYWNQLGTCYFLKSDYAKAILFYNKSRDLDSKYIPPVNNLGVVYQAQGRFQKALSAFKLAGDLNNFSVTPTYNLAQLYLRFGTVGKALPIFQGLQKRSPKDTDVGSALASANLIKGDYQAAVDIYSRFDKEILAMPSVGLNYALALKLLNRPIDAQTVLGNVASGNGAISEYAQKVEKFIRN